MLVSLLIIGSLVQSAAVPLQEHIIRYSIQLLQAFYNNINTHNLYNLKERVHPKWKGVNNRQKCPYAISSNCKALERYNCFTNRNRL